MVLVSKLFDGMGFESWKHAMGLALSCKNKLGFINGTNKKLDPSSAEFSILERCNSMVISWILNALSKEIQKVLSWIQRVASKHKQ